MASKDYIPRAVEGYAFDEQLIGRHMVFLAGPRQVGKTMLARHWIDKMKCERLYFNWDDIATRQAFAKDSRFFESVARVTTVDDPWIVFDEIHKRPNWRDILKGTYDVFGGEFRFLVTGSARLDLFRRAGDALVGRYNLFHMMPLSLGEILNSIPANNFLSHPSHEQRVAVFDTEVSNISPSAAEAMESLSAFGPFPEPFLRQNQRFCRKWHQDYISLLIRQDLRDISKVAELDKVEHMALLLPQRVSAPLSMMNLSREIEVAHTTIKAWLAQLKRLYLIFGVQPWSHKISRGLKKSTKWYFVDWYYTPEAGPRLENLVATCLYRTCLALTDMGFGRFELHYIRTLDKKEIDFVVTRDHAPLLAVEVKSGQSDPSRALTQRHRWFGSNRTIGVQLVDKRDVFKKYPDDTWVLSVERFLGLLI